MKILHLKSAVGSGKTWAMDGATVGFTTRDGKSSACMAGFMPPKQHLGDLTQISVNTYLSFTIDLNPSINLPIACASQGLHYQHTFL